MTGAQRHRFACAWHRRTPPHSLQSVKAGKQIWGSPFLASTRVTRSQKWRKECGVWKETEAQDIVTSGFPGDAAVKNPPTKQEIWVRFLGQEDPLEEEKASHPSILTREIPWTEEPGGIPSTGSQRIGHDSATRQQSRSSPVQSHFTCESEHLSGRGPS